MNKMSKSRKKDDQSKSFNTEKNHKELKKKQKMKSNLSIDLHKTE